MQHTRKCPTCEVEIVCKTKQYLKQSEKKGRLCKSCGAKARIAKYGYGEKFEKFTLKGSCAGESNPFYGKKHTDSTKEKMKNVDKDKSFFQTLAYKQKQSIGTSGIKNPMYGKTVYQTWIDKYGKEKADLLKIDWLKKQSINSTGKKNPMYGKPSPQGSGNGWSGWYKTWYFRSLKELSYVVNVLEANKDEWECAGKIKIPYINWNGSERTYSPDFLVNNKSLIEIKPKRLISSPSVLLKKEAAEIFCKKQNWDYFIIDPPEIRMEQIKLLYGQKLIKFTKRYEEKYKQLNN